ncbi:Sugar/inositol transporter,Major facilitator superfamily domain,Major facilitator, sugar transporter- [Cinara cedri]|uniref:Sugar/inositol transporter,Major facilitator superfamily domain,Major facilitator, sugar transporter n=1 Tax=Cinara cedri TaxID=506608 RepID=A0A5E4M0S0_9HEMI|nr:Sugar/inositol transporter,Major facilitator superfamily domain,Major facilitator, sugar transporter- [Cinara cedri]
MIIIGNIKRFNSGHFRQLFAATAANLVSFTYGVYTGWSATVTPKLQDPKTTPLETVMTNESLSWMCSWGMFSAIFGSFIWGFVANKYGRKATGFFTMIPYLVSWIILLQIKTETALMVSRFLGGLGGSGAAINIPLYVAEISNKDMKAGLGSLFILMYNIGVLYAYIFGVFVSYDSFNVACLMITVLYMFVWCCVPESPVFYIQQNQMDYAKKSVQWLQGKDTVDNELSELTNSGDHMSAATTADYTDKRLIKALIIGIVFQSGTQLSGINVILMDTVNIFKRSGGTLGSEYCTMLVGVVQVVGSIIAVCTVNRASRKFFLISTYALTSLALITIGCCFYATNVMLITQGTGIIPVLSLSLHVMAFSLGLGMVPYIIYAEIFPANVRNMCMSILMVWNNVLGFAVLKGYPKMTELMGEFGYYWMFGLVCLAIVPFTYFFVPETKGKTIKDILEDLLLWFPDFGNRNTVDITTKTEQKICDNKNNHKLTKQINDII